MSRTKPKANSIEYAIDQSGVKADLTSILQDVMLSTLMIDINLRISYINPAFTKLLGYRPKDIVGQHMDMLLTPEEQAAVAKSRATIKKDKLQHTVTERQFVHKNGSVVHVLSSAFIYNNADEKPSLIIIRLMDISAQKKAEVELKASEERSKLALQSGQQGVWDVNTATRAVHHSDMWFEIRGRDPKKGNPSFQQWIKRVHPDDRVRVIKNSEDRIKGVFEKTGLEYRERHVDGHWIWILSRGCAVSWLEDGSPKRIIGTDTDITDVKESEHELEILTSRLELALATSKVGVWDVDLKTGNVQWDEVMRVIYDQPDVDLKKVPSDLWDLQLHPEDAKTAINNMKVAIKAKSEVEQDYRIILPNKEVRHIRAICRYYEDDNGNTKFLGVDRDVTEEVNAAEHLKQVVGDLQSAKKLTEEKNDQLEVAHSRMEHNSLHDALTGLPNRRYLDEVLTSFSNEKRGACLLHIDLDRFKQINDTLGHAAGDAMLVHAAEILRSNVARSDFVARVGGDEFVLFIDETKSPEDLAALSSRIIKKMSAPVDYKGHECRFGVSVGIVHEAGKKIDIKQMLVNADIALYLAKENGRNRYEFFTVDMQSNIIGTKNIADEILAGLERNEFLPHYQPQFDAKTLKVVGVESLVRWNHPSKGLLAPHAFLKIAEDLDVVADIDRLMLEQTLFDMYRWHADGIDIPKASVNVSVRRLRDERLIEGLVDLNFRPGTLSFELLESIFLDDDEGDDLINHNIERIRDLGIGIEIDDFGSGHASIVGLLRLGPDRLKIDRQLIMPIVKSQKQRDLVRSIIEIGKSLGIKIVAEGVETLEHVNILRDLGCDVLQGYFFAEPMAASDIESFVKDQVWRKAS